MDTPQTLTNGQEPEAASLKEFTEFELDDALYDLDDLMARCQMFYCVLKDTAKAIVDAVPLYGDGIDIGIRRIEFRKECINTIKTYQPDVVVTDDLLEYNFNGVPVRIHVLPSKNPLYETYDFRWHKTWQYNIPNPFDKYWESI